MAQLSPPRVSFDRAVGAGSAGTCLSPRGGKCFSALLSTKRERVEDEASGEVAAPVRATHRRIHVGRDAPRGQVFPNESLRPVPVEASRGVADAWKMDARCHKRRKRTDGHNTYTGGKVLSLALWLPVGRGGGGRLTVCVCVFTHTYVKSRASHSARSYVRYVLGQDCNREENNAMEHSIWKQRDRWPRWKSNEQRFLNKAQAETRRVRTLQRTVRCGAEQPVWPAPLRDGSGAQGAALPSCSPGALEIRTRTAQRTQRAQE